MHRHNNLSEKACHSFAILTAALEHHQRRKFVKPDDYVLQHELR